MWVPSQCRSLGKAMETAQQGCLEKSLCGPVSSVESEGQGRAKRDLEQADGCVLLGDGV